MEPGEIQLLERLRQQDQRAYRELMNRYGDSVVNTCYGFLRTEEDARDAAQEVFVEVYRSIRWFRGDSTLSTWLHRMAVNKSLDALRHRKRKKRSPSVQESPLPDHPEERDQENRGDTPLSLLLQKERMEMIQRAIDLLPLAQRIAWTLHKTENKPQQEVAEIMETSVSAVESLIHRAKIRLRKSLRNHF